MRAVSGRLDEGPRTMGMPRSSPPGDVLPALAGGLTRRRRIAGALILLLGLPLVTTVLLQRREELSYATPVLLVLLVVVLTALLGGVWVAVPAALLGGLTLNWFFTPPYGTLVVTEPSQLLVLVVYLAVAFAVAVIVDIAARQTAAARRARAEANALSSLAGATLAEAQTLPQLLERIRDMFRMRWVGLEEQVDGHSSVAASTGDERPTTDEVRLTAAAGPGLTLVARGPELLGADRRLLATFAEAAGTALEGRRLAEQAQQKARLEALEQSRMALLTSVGHDLRTPLAGIKAAASSLRQPGANFSVGDREELLETIETSADRLHTLVTNLLDASRVRSGLTSTHVEPTPVEDSLVQIVTALPPTERARVSLDIHQPLSHAVADPVLLERVMANLLDNALRHTPAMSPVSIVGRSRGGSILLEVVDHGPGIPAAQLESVFTPLQRLDDRAQSGLGLGLAIARGFTEAMHGTLIARPTPGGGLTMRIALPAASEDRPS
jgi:K+-sensing histidine kinase KdpD